MNNKPPRETPTSLIDFFPKISTYIFGITILCYLAGFAITNMYLGSWGIVNIDIIKTRYILAGGLFLLFLGAIYILIIDLRTYLKREQNTSRAELLLNIATRSLFNISYVYITILALSYLTGSNNISAEQIFLTSSIFSFSSWINNTLSIIKALAPVLAIVVLITLLIVYLTVVLIIIIINPAEKNGDRKTRKQNLAEILKFSPASLRILISIYLIILVGISLLHLLYRLILNNSSNAFPEFTGLSANWFRYFIAIVIIYLLIASVIIFISITRSPKDVNYSRETLNLSKKIATEIIFLKIMLVSLAIIIILPVYTFGIYPYIPQHVGGGLLLKVEIILSTNEFIHLFENPDTETYIIDRTTNSTIFLLTNAKNNIHKVVEITNSIIQGITYKSSP